MVKSVQETLVEVELTYSQKQYYRAILEKNVTFLKQVPFAPARPRTAHTHPTPPRPLSSSSSLSPLSPLSSWSSSCSSCSSRPPAAAHAALRPPPARNVGPSCLPDSLAMGPRPPKMTVLDH